MKLQSDKTRRAGNAYETHHLTRGPAPGPYAQSAEGVFRLRRSRLLCRGNAARQPRRSSADQVSAAHSGGCVETRSLDHHPRGARIAAADPGADWTVRHATPRWG